MKLVIVSNRLPVVVEKRGGGFEVREAVGGLATAVRSFLKATGGGKELGFTKVVWVGWPGVREDDGSVRKILEESGLYPVSLTAEEISLFYEGFSNSTLWPLFHSFTEYTVFEERFWQAYVRVNEKFAKSVASLAEPGDFIWVHDYHLMLAPSFIKQQAPETAVGFFLHIPFPPAEIYQLMPPPWRAALLEGVLASDLVGFHVHEYVNNFLRSVFKFLGHPAEGGVVKVGRRKVRVGAFPISIDFSYFYNSSNEVAAQIEELRNRLRGLKVVFSIDRLDYTKGVLKRLEAWERFLKEYPQWRGRAVFMLVVVPSRTGVPQYEAMKREIDRAVGRINGEFGEVDWVPVVYISRFIPTPTLLALYNVADVALITPLRDGMNLVAKEYVASRRDCRGVLILSETAGAAHELVEALIVNPNDVSGVAAAIAKALSMPQEEQCRRIEAMQKRLLHHDVVKWAVDFIQALAVAYGERSVSNVYDAAKPLDAAALHEAFSKAERRLLLLDYDGTLVPLYPYAYQAVPDRELIQLLTELAKLPNTVVAVVSGRSREFLEAWLGELPICLVAEHGAYIKEKGGQWVQLFPFDVSWKQAARAVIENFTKLVPGSYIEEKESSIAWHFRNVDPEVGESAAHRLVEALSGVLQGTGGVVLRGSRVVEVRPAGVSKGAAAKRLVEALGPDFVLAAGDDATDEEMFQTLGEGAFTIKVGAGETSAKYFVTAPYRLREALRTLLTRPLY